MLLFTIFLSAAIGLVGDQVVRAGARRRKATARPIGLPAQPIDRPTTVVQRFLQVERQSPRMLIVGGAIGACLLIAPVVPMAIVLVPAIAIGGGASNAFRSGLAHFRAHRRLNEDALDGLVMGMATFSQFFIPLLFTMPMFWVRERLLLAVRDNARRELSDLFGKPTASAWLLLPDGTEVETPIERLAAGDTVVVNAGEPVPVDGTVVSGSGRVDQRMLTGEEHPIEVLNGDDILAATQMVSGRVFLRVTKTGSNTAAGQVIAQIERTTEYRLTVQTKAEGFTEQTIPFRLAAGAASVPWIGVYRAGGLMNVGPGAFINVYAPIGMLHWLTLGARRNVVIRDGRTLEAIPSVDTVVFDKTGTLTEPTPAVIAIHAAAGALELDILLSAAAAEYRQQHPIAHALRDEAVRRGLTVPTPEHQDYVASNGVQAMVDGVLIAVGSARFMASSDLRIADPLLARERVAQATGGMIVFVARDDVVLGGIELRAQVRPEARAVVAQLRARGCHVRILSGDGWAQTAVIAAELDVDGFDAEVLPIDKAHVVKRLQDGGRRVCFIGDGINDVVAMRQARVSVAVANATNAATAVAGVVLLEKDLNRVLDLFAIGDEFARRGRQALAASVVPTGLGAFAVLSLGGGLLATSMLNQMSLATSIAVLTRPWRNDRERIAPRLGTPIETARAEAGSDARPNLNPSPDARNSATHTKSHTHHT